MESGMMKVVFASIINGSHWDLSANDAKYGLGEPDVKAVNRFKPKIQYSKPREEADVYDVYKEKTSREVFSALVNASNCANLHIDNDPDEFLTFIPHGTVIRKRH